MIVRRIEIENFRGIRKASIDGFNQLTILIGKNGAVTPRASSLEDAELLRKLGIDPRLLYAF